MRIQKLSVRVPRSGKRAKLAIWAVAISAAAGSLGSGRGSSAFGTLIVGESQFNSGDVAPSPIVAVGDDLLQTNLASVTGENPDSAPENGVTGTAHENDASAPAKIWGSAQTTYNLDTSTNSLGYNIKEIRSFSGWMDGRAGQSYTLSYSLAADPSTFLTLGTVSDIQSDGSLLDRTYDDTGANILTGVAAIQLNQIDSGLAGTGTVFREIDVLGTPTTAAPEPASISLLAFGGVLALRRRRPRAG